MGNIKQWIEAMGERFPRLYCFQRILRHLHDVGYVNRVLEVDQPFTGEYLHWRDPYCMYIEHTGNRFPHRINYLIEGIDYAGGFCTIYHRLLLALSYADFFGMTPTVHWDNRHPCYNNKLFGTKNVFEYYFEQPGLLVMPEVLVSKNVVFYLPIHLCMQLQKPFERYNVADRELKLCAQMQKQYMRLRPELARAIKLEVDDCLGEQRVLGVHIRGTSFEWGLNDYPISSSREVWIANIKRAMRKNKSYKFFLATDDQNVVEWLREYFGDDMITFQDAFRARGMLPVQYCHSDRENHSYLLGYEVLRDIICLSYCRGLLTDMSQVGMLAQVFKLSRDEQYEYKVIIDKEKHKKSTVLADAQRRLLEQNGFQI